MPSLAVPDPVHLPQGQATLLRVMMGYEGVQLFVERAQAVQKTFHLTASNAMTVAELCSRLEGIPLAIELAAARVNAMSVGQITSRLYDHLGLLLVGSRTTLPRQQTLRAALDWSYELLSDHEQTMLRRVSVFAGGWTLEAAEQVCEGAGIEIGKVADLLISLVDKSLIVFEESGLERCGRYRLLEMVRQYAAAKLQASAETAPTNTRHRDWLVRLVERGGATVKRRRAAEVDGAARGRARKPARDSRTGRGRSGGGRVRLAACGGFWRFWSVRGYYSEGREYLEKLLNRQDEQTVSAARAKALYGAGVLAYSQADYVSARTRYAESLSIRRDLGDRQGAAEVLGSLGTVAYDHGDYGAARALYEESLSICRDLGDLEGVAWSLGSLANVAHPQGEYASARALYEESLSLFRKLNQRRGIAWSLIGLGKVAYDQGEHAAARTLYEESLSLCRDLGDKPDIAWSLSSLGNIAHDQGNLVLPRRRCMERA